MHVLVSSVSILQGSKEQRLWKRLQALLAQGTTGKNIQKCEYLAECDIITDRTRLKSKFSTSIHQGVVFFS